MKFIQAIIFSVAVLAGVGCAPQGQKAELDAANKRIAQLEAELKAERAKPAASASLEKVTAAASTAASAAPTVVDPPRQSAWIYAADEDKMTGRQRYVASVFSQNTVNFGFPYAGEQHGRLMLRIDPKYGKDVIFSIEKGQLLCHSYEDCTVMIRFDDGKPETFSAVGAADNSTETVFIRNYDRFVGKLRNAKVVRLSMNIYQQGAPVFEFLVDGFDQNQYTPKPKK